MHEHGSRKPRKAGKRPRKGKRKALPNPDCPARPETKPFPAKPKRMDGALYERLRLRCERYESIADERLARVLLRWLKGGAFLIKCPLSSSNRILGFSNESALLAVEQAFFSYTAFDEKSSEFCLYPVFLLVASKAVWITLRSST